MAVVEGLTGFVPDTESRGFRARRRARAQAAQGAEWAPRVQERVFLETHPVYEELKSKASSLPGRPKLSISKDGKNTDVIVSFGRKFSLRRMEVSWSSVVVGVEKSTDELSIKLNAGVVPANTDEGQINSVVQRAIDVPFPRVWSIPDHPMEYLGERWRIGRERIKLPKK